MTSVPYDPDEAGRHPVFFDELLRRARHPASRVFLASYDGECATCLLVIEPGDEVCYEDDELVHADCRAELVPDD